MARKKKPNVLIICPFYPPNMGGVEIHLQLLTDYLKWENYRVFVLTYRPLVSRVNYQAYEKKKNVTIWRFWWFGHGWFDQFTVYPPLQFLYVVPGLLFCSFFWMIKNHRQIQVIHAHGFAAAFITRLIGPFFPSKRKVVSTHFIYKRPKPKNLYGWLFKQVFSGFDQILLIGKESKRELRALGLRTNKMKLFRHWLDQKKFLPQSKQRCRRKLGLPQGAKLIVLFMGRLLRMKGLFELLEVAKSLPEDIIFVLVGDGPDSELLASKSGEVKNFLLVGRKSRDQVVTYLGACDFLILPSLAEEAQPLVVMEALTCGRPVVTTNKGAVGEMFDSSVGITISPTSDNIRQVILDFYHHPEKLKKMTAKTRQFALKKYSPENAKVITDSYQ